MDDTHILSSKVDSSANIERIARTPNADTNVS